MLRTRFIGLALIVSVSGMACHSRPPAAAPSRPVAPAATVPAQPPAPAPPPSPAAAPPAAPLSDAELFDLKSLAELNAEHPLGDPFFEYDQNTLQDEARRTLQQDAEWLAKWPRTIVRIDGYCDERGTAEYNLALGERRSDAVREYLVSLGIRPERIETRSLGKEAAFCHESGEPCWAQNRRGHFVITTK